MKNFSPKQKAGGLFLLLLLFAGGAGPAPPPKKKGKKKKDSEAARQARVVKALEWARPAAKKYGVPLSIVLAVLDVESHGWPNATSPVGAMGYMQLMPDTAKTYVPKGVDPYDPAANIDGGVHLLRDLYDDFPGDWYAVWTAYNAGPKRLRRNKKTGKYKKNYRMVYVNAVLDRLKIWQHY